MNKRRERKKRKRKAARRAKYNSSPSYLHLGGATAFPEEIAPCDKWHIKSSAPVNTDWLNACRSANKKPSIPFGFDAHKSGVYVLPNKAKITLFVGKTTRLHMNPTQWDSYTGMRLFLERLFQDHYSGIRIYREAYHCDLKVPKDQVDKTVLYRNKICRETFIEHEKEKAGRSIEKSITGIVGSKRARTIGDYDSSAKHGFPNPSTRIEITNHAPSYLFIDHPDQLPTLIHRNIFSDEMGFYRVTPKPKLSKRQAAKLEKLNLKISMKGLDTAFKEMRRESSNFDRDLKKYATLEKVELDPDKAFHERLERFIKKPVSSIEEIIANAPVLKARKMPVKKIKGTDFKQKLKLNIMERDRNLRAIATALSTLIKGKWDKPFLENGENPSSADDIQAILRNPVFRILQFLSTEIIEAAKNEGWDLDLLKPIVDEFCRAKQGGLLDGGGYFDCGYFDS